MTVTSIIIKFINIGLKLIPFFASMAFLVFLIGVGRFIKASGNDAERKTAKNFLIWGIIGLFILVCIWGIVSFFQKEIGINDPLGIPQIRFNK